MLLILSLQLKVKICLFYLQNQYIPPLSFILFSILCPINESRDVSIKYNKATVIHVSNGEKVFATISLPTFVKSVIDITDTNELSLTKDI